MKKKATPLKLVLDEGNIASPKITHIRVGPESRGVIYRLEDWFESTISLRLSDIKAIVEYAKKIEPEQFLEN